MNLYAVILAGGSGTRFWPKSRRNFPKQFLALQGTRSLLQHTVRRTTLLMPLARIYVVTATHLRTRTASELPELPPTNILSEPVGRDTAAAVGLAALHLVVLDPQAMMVVLPADHVIPERATYCDSLHQAAEAAQQYEKLMILGVTPDFPATGYGYIKVGPSLSTPGSSLAHQATQFIDQPCEAEAAHLGNSGEYLWHSGILAGRAATILEEITTHLPDLAAGLRAYSAVVQAGAATDVLLEHYRQLPKISFDKGVLAKSSRVGVLPAPFACNDVGSWGALAALYPPDGDGNVVIGNHIGQDAKGLVVYSPEKLVATVGLSNLIIVQTGDVTLICAKERDQDVRDLVEMLQQRGQTQYLWKLDSGYYHNAAFEKA